MRLCKSWIEASPFDSHRVRVMGEVEYADRTREVYWYDFDRSLEPLLDRSGSPWLVALLPLAFTVGEPLTISADVDPTLLTNVHEVMNIWSTWYPALRPVAVTVDGVRSTPTEGRCAAFFSGGVDSFFTVLRHDERVDYAMPAGEAKAPIDDLLLIWGFDVPLDHAAEFARMRAGLQKAAAAFGKPLIDVATNLRETRFSRADWSALSHASGLASVGLMLSPRFATVLLASFGFQDGTPWGSHPVTDALLSTSSTRTVHDGAEASRVEKTRLIAKSPVALEHLHVCWRYGSDVNCSNCNKCYRTMATLYVLNALEACPAFDARGFSVRKLKWVYSEPGWSRRYFEEIGQLAADCGRRDVAKAIHQSLRRSHRICGLLDLNQEVSRHMFRWPFVWRYSTPLRQRVRSLVLSRAIT